MKSISSRYYFIALSMNFTPLFSSHECTFKWIGFTFNPSILKMMQTTTSEHLKELMKKLYTRNLALKWIPKTTFLRHLQDLLLTLFFIVSQKRSSVNEKFIILVANTFMFISFQFRSLEMFFVNVHTFI